MATGKGAFLSVDGTDISGYTRSVENNFTQDEVESTVLTSQYREFEPTYARNVLTIRMKWSPAVQTFIDAHSPNSTDSADYLDLPYIYGPDGDAEGKVRIQGLANVTAAQEIPPANPGTLSEVTMTLNLNSATKDTFPAETP